MREETTSYYSPVVTNIATAVYHHWMKASPSNYPPNLHSRVESKDGGICKWDNPAIGIGLKEYKQLYACDAKYVELIWEFTPNGGEALQERMVWKLGVRGAGATYWSFGSCNSCWKWGRRNFTDTKLTGHPLSVPVDNPSIPRLGRCGCVICNECVLELEMHKTNKYKMDVHCPYCGNEECFSKHMRIWLVSEEISNLNCELIV